MRRSQARRDHDRIHLEPEDLIHIPTLSDETLEKIALKRDFMHDELNEVDQEMQRVVRAMREASCAKYARALYGSKNEAEDASDDDGEICENESR
jgi:hypothetical protein